MTPDDTRPVSPAATDRLRRELQRLSLPQRPATAPMAVVFGGMDTLLPPAWTETALRTACGMGDVIDIVVQPDKNHNDVDESLVPGWLKDRLDGVPPPSTCESFTTPPAPEQDSAQDDQQDDQQDNEPDNGQGG